MKEEEKQGHGSSRNTKASQKDKPIVHKLSSIEAFVRIIPRKRISIRNLSEYTGSVTKSGFAVPITETTKKRRSKLNLPPLREMKEWPLENLMGQKDGE